MSSIPSQDFAVSRCDMNLFWPIELAANELAEHYEAPGTGHGSDRLKDWVDLFCKDGHWKELPDGPTMSGTFDPIKYSEWAYFHPHVRNFLYKNPSEVRASSPNRNLRILSKVTQRLLFLCLKPFKDLKESVSPSDLRLYCHGQELYIFDTGIAILRLRLSSSSTVAPDEIDKDSGWSLADVLTFQDLARRLYVPFFDKGEDRDWTCSLVPEEFHFGFSDGVTEIQKTCDPGSVDQHIAYTSVYREPYTLPTWSKLLLPGVPARSQCEGSQLRYYHLEDERAQVMTYVSLDRRNGYGAEHIDAGDWIRIATVDGPGTAGSFPYGETFSTEKFKEMAYDRYWDPGKGWTTRWLC
ncbi:MAG: hypothetical protein ABL921_34960, partial [Pirellula sp.]